MASRRSGLGKNLSALLGSSYTEPTVTTITLPLAALCAGKYQPRTRIEETALQELADSIKAQGLLQPILVRQIAQNQYEIIAGERRFRASELAGLSEIPVIIRQVTDETATAMALVENLQREDLNAIDQARAMARLCNEFSLSHQEIAKLLSKSRASVSNFLRLLSLQDEVCALLEQGHLDMGHARALLSLEAEEQIRLAKLIVTKQLSVRETERLVTRIKEGLSAEKKEPISFPEALQQQVEAIAKRFQAKVSLRPKPKGKGALVLHYDSITMLERLIAKLAV